MSGNKKQDSNNNPYSSWHTSNKQKQFRNEDEIYKSQQTTFSDQKNKQNRSQNNYQNDQRKRRRYRSTQNKNEVEYVRKYPVQSNLQGANSQINSNKSQNSQSSYSKNNQTSQRSRQVEEIKPQQKNQQKNDRQNNSQQIQEEKRNTELNNNKKTVNQTNSVFNEWKSDPKKYIASQFYQNEDSYYHPTTQIFKGKKPNVQQVLLVAEKPSIARKIASALSNKTSKRVQSVVKYLPVFEYEDKFKGKKTIFKVTSVAGHVYKIDFPQKLKDWNRINPIKLFAEKAVMKPEKPNIVRHLENVAKNCSYLLLWLDNDREGENISFQVKSICEKVMCYEGNNVTQVLRSKFSSLTKADIWKAFKDTTEPPDENKSKSVDARRIIDLKIGAAFTRYQTLFFRDKYVNLNERIISFGPCQTPTLAFCVEREDEIKNFVPKLQYRVKLILTDSKKKSEIIAYYDSKETFTKNQAQEVLLQIKTQNQVSVTSVKGELIRKKSPKGLNTVEMLKSASTLLHMSPEDTSKVAENLYLKGFITYPRTESTAYPKSFNFNKILSSLKQDKGYGKYAQELNQEYRIPTEGIDVGDHPPITPTQNYPRPENKGLITEEERNLYNYISKHFLASLSDDYEYTQLGIKFNIKEYQFISEGIQVEQSGYTEIIEENQQEQIIIEKNVKEGSKLEIKSSQIEQYYTSPPHYLSESELIDLMEKNSIGTDASIASHISNIVDRSYVKIDENNRTLIPTELGRSLIDGYKKIDQELVQPKIRATIENLANQIFEGEEEFSEVINQSLKIFQDKYINFVQNIKIMDNLVGLFSKTYQEILSTAESLSKCGLCNQEMKLVTESGQLVCQKCDFKLYLPINGKFKVNEDVCKEDQFQLIQFIPLNSDEKEFPFCPKCYSDQHYRKQRR